MAFDKKLLDVLACPVCKGKLLWVADKQSLVCRFDRLAYDVKEGIPVLIEEKAHAMSLEEIEQLR